MRHAALAAIASLLFAASAAQAQPGDRPPPDAGYGDDGPGDDGGYGPDDGYGYGYGVPVPDARDYGTVPPPAGASRPMPAYEDNDNWQRGRRWSSGDARADSDPAPPPPPAPPRVASGDRQAYRDARAAYRARLDDWNRRYGRPAVDPRDRDRVARWRARADACEAGDRAACDGPE